MFLKSAVNNCLSLNLQSMVNAMNRLDINDTHQPPLYQIQINQRCGNCKSRKATYKSLTGTHMSLESNVDMYRL